MYYNIIAYVLCDLTIKFDNQPASQLGQTSKKGSSGIYFSRAAALCDDSCDDREF